MRGATRVTLQHHEVLCLPRKQDSHHGSLSRTIRPEQRRPYSHHLCAVLFGILHWSEAKPVARIASQTWKVPQARMEKVKLEKNCQKKRKKIANLDWPPFFGTEKTQPFRPSWNFFMAVWGWMKYDEIYLACSRGWRGYVELFGWNETSFFLFNAISQSFK